MLAPAVNPVDAVQFFPVQFQVLHGPVKAAGQDDVGVQDPHQSDSGSTTNPASSAAPNSPLQP